MVKTELLIERPKGATQQADIELGHLTFRLIHDNSFARKEMERLVAGLAPKASPERIKDAQNLLSLGQLNEGQLQNLRFLWSEGVRDLGRILMQHAGFQNMKPSDAKTYFESKIKPREISAGGLSSQMNLQRNIDQPAEIEEISKSLVQKEEVLTEEESRETPNIIIDEMDHDLSPDLDPISQSANELHNARKRRTGAGGVLEEELKMDAKIRQGLRAQQDKEKQGISAHKALSNDIPKRKKTANSAEDSQDEKLSTSIPEITNSIRVELQEKLRPLESVKPALRLAMLRDILSSEAWGIIEALRKIPENMREAVAVDVVNKLRLTNSPRVIFPAVIKWKPASKDRDTEFTE